MTISITIKGSKFRAKTIPKREILSAWKTLTSAPLPKVKGFRMKNSDFDHIMELTRNPEDEKREVEEWGRVLSIKGTDACVLTPDESVDADYVILVRETPYHSLGKILKHELSHVIRGDL